MNWKWLVIENKCFFFENFSTPDLVDQVEYKKKEFFHLKFDLKHKFTYSPSGVKYPGKLITKKAGLEKFFSSFKHKTFCILSTGCGILNQQSDHSAFRNALNELSKNDLIDMLIYRK